MSEIQTGKAQSASPFDEAVKVWRLLESASRDAAAALNSAKDAEREAGSYRRSAETHLSECQEAEHKAWWRIKQLNATVSGEYEGQSAEG